MIWWYGTNCCQIQSWERASIEQDKIPWLWWNQYHGKLWEKYITSGNEKHRWDCGGKISYVECHNIVETSKTYRILQRNSKASLIPTIDDSDTMLAHSLSTFITRKCNHPEFFITLDIRNEVELTQREHKRRHSLTFLVPPTTPTSKTLPMRSKRGLLKEFNKLS